MTLILIPTYNEGKTIASVIMEIQATFPSGHILLVDDGSTDETKAIVTEMEIDHFISHESNLGYGQALITGFNFFRESKFSVLVTFDADGQHNPNEIQPMINALLTNDVEIISGSRFLSDSPQLTAAPPERVEVNRIVSEIINAKTNYALTDAFCGFKAYSKNAISKLNPKLKGYGFPFELFLLAKKNHLRVKEFPISIIYNDDPRELAYYVESSLRDLRSLLGDVLNEDDIQFMISYFPKFGIDPSEFF